MINNEKLFAIVDNLADVIAKVNDEVWRAAEVYFKEYKSADALAKAAEEYGFATEMGVSGIPTAFVSKWGEKGPKIGILAEYETTGTYWAFYINGEYGLTGVDKTDITDGATYTFKVEKA